MAIGTKTGGRPFEPGNKAAVGHGPHRVNAEIKRMREQLGEDLVRIVKSIWGMNQSEAVAYLNRPEATFGEKWVGQIFSRGAKNGDAQRLATVLNYVVGKPMQHVSLSNPDGGPLQLESENKIVAMLPMNGREAKEDDGSSSV